MIAMFLSDKNTKRVFAGMMFDKELRTKILELPELRSAKFDIFVKDTEEDSNKSPSFVVHNLADAKHFIRYACDAYEAGYGR